MVLQADATFIWSEAIGIDDASVPAPNVGRHRTIEFSVGRSCICGSFPEPLGEPGVE
jgi:hypothetical protein